MNRKLIVIESAEAYFTAKATGNKLLSAMAANNFEAVLNEHLKEDAADPAKEAKVSQSTEKVSQDQMKKDG